MNKVYVTNENCEVLDELYDDNALTDVGLSEDSVGEFLDWIKEHTKILNENVYVIKGSLMNEYYGLTDDNAYSDDLTIVAIKLKDIKEPQKLFIPRFEVGARWFNDVVDNNARRQA